MKMVDLYTCMCTFFHCSTSGIIPVRWTAPEGLTNQKFSAASDVWSFGIVCIEVYTDGATPYLGITSNPHVMAFVNGGDIHPQPPSCTAHVYRELCRCWAFEPDQRPTFEDMNRVFASLQASSETGIGLPASPTSVPTHGYDLGFQGRAGGTGQACRIKVASVSTELCKYGPVLPGTRKQVPAPEEPRTSSPSIWPQGIGRQVVQLHAGDEPITFYGSFFEDVPPTTYSAIGNNTSASMFRPGFVPKDPAGDLMASPTRKVGDNEVSPMAVTKGMTTPSPRSVLQQKLGRKRSTNSNTVYPFDGTNA